MKKILSFIHESEELSREMLCNIYGGHAGTVSTSSSQVTERNGQCQLEEVTDSFDDCNGDGVWGPGESGTRTTTLTPVKCVDQIIMAP